MKDKIFSFEKLKLAFKRLKTMSTIDVKDYYGESLFDLDLRNNINQLQDDIINGVYVPSKPFKYYQPKPSHTQRTKTILNTRDAIVYLAITDYVANLSYDSLNENENFVFGNILSKTYHSKHEGESEVNMYKPYRKLYNNFIDSTKKQIKLDKTHILECDITGFFDSISHGVLVEKLSGYSIDEEVLQLLIDCLNVWSGTSERITPYIGLPQGPISSFLYANIVLNDLDTEMKNNGFSYYRYTDDMKIFGRNEEEVYSALVLIDSYLKSHGLSINSSKTEIYNLKEYYKNEQYKRLKAHSLDIDITPEVIENLDSEYAYQIDDKELEYMNIPDDVAKALISNKISHIESQILSIGDDPENILKYEKDILTYNFIWRYYVRFLYEKYQQAIAVNENIIRVWLSQLSILFWRANHFAVNLSLIHLEKEFVNSLIDIEKLYNRYEWFRYQTLLAISNSYGKNSYEFKQLFDRLNNEDSPLVRTGIYTVLINNSSHDDQLYSSIMHRVKNDNSVYVQESVLQYILLNQDDKLDKWFAL